MPVNAQTKLRDADRSRLAILDAAEALFSERGFDGASLAEIAGMAGVSRATPSYFFGSKEDLYVAVLARVFRERQSAATIAFRPLLAWVQDRGGPEELRSALEVAADGYVGFLLERPSFLRLLQHEDLAGGRRLAATPRERNAMAASFDALRAVAPQRGIRRFDVDSAVLLFVSLTFSPLTQRSTFMAVLGYDLNIPVIRRKHVRLVADQVLHLVMAPTRPESDDGL